MGGERGGGDAGGGEERGELFGGAGEGDGWVAGLEGVDECGEGTAACGPEEQDGRFGG